MSDDEPIFCPKCDIEMVKQGVTITIDDETPQENPDDYFLHCPKCGEILIKDED